MNKPHCSHCGKPATEVKHLFSSRLPEGDGAHICDECLLTYYAIYSGHDQAAQHIEADIGARTDSPGSARGDEEGYPS